VRYPALTVTFELVRKGVAIVMGLKVAGVLFSRAVSVSLILGDIAVAADTLPVG